MLKKIHPLFHASRIFSSTTIVRTSKRVLKISISRRLPSNNKPTAVAPHLLPIDLVPSSNKTNYNQVEHLEVKEEEVDETLLAVVEGRIVAVMVIVGLTIVSIQTSNNQSQELN